MWGSFRLKFRVKRTTFACCVCVYVCDFLLEHHMEGIVWRRTCLKQQQQWRFKNEIQLKKQWHVYQQQKQHRHKWDGKNTNTGGEREREGNVWTREMVYAKVFSINIGLWHGNMLLWWRFAFSILFFFFKLLLVLIMYSEFHTCMPICLAQHRIV